MLISSNELNALLKRVFEGMGYPLGSYEDAADMVKWLQRHGEQGFAELERALPHVADRGRPALTVSEEGDRVLLVDCHGRSALNCLPGVVELAQAKALAWGSASVELGNCHNRKFILKLLVDCAHLGISGLAYWQNGRQAPNEHVASIAAGADHPCYSQAPLERADVLTEPHGLSLLLSTRVDLHGELHGAGARGPGYRKVTAEHFAQAGEEGRERGLEISSELWQRLNRLGEAVLVANSERSRSGAGGR